MDEMKKDAWKNKLYIIIFQTDTPNGKRFDIYLLIFILLSVLIATVESVVAIDKRLALPFQIVDWTITSVFTVEYILRIYCSPDRRKYILSMYGIIDLMAILPSFIGFFIVGTHYLIVIRALRLLRVFRVFKLTHFIRETASLTQSIRRSLSKILIFAYFIIILVVILGALMYMVEGGVNPSFSNIPKSIYWAVVTLTTVGYGDATPITFWGKLISVVVMLLGYSILAVPTGIVSAEMIKPLRQKKTVCKNCGNEEHELDAHYCKHCGAALDQ